MHSRYKLCMESSNALCSFLLPHFVFGFTDDKNAQCCLLGYLEVAFQLEIC